MVSLRPRSPTNLLRTWVAALVTTAAVAAASACGDDASGGQCIDTRQVAQVYYGTSGPTFAPLTPGQIMAIAEVGACSGTLIGPSWALSAEHCNLVPGAQFCMGEQSDNADQCLAILEVHRAPLPDSDLVLLQLDGDARDVLPAVEPIPILTEALDDTWLGELAEGAGYGETEANEYGTRLFTTEPIVEIDSTFIHVDGEGAHGLCGGDSGGPLLVIAADNTARVAGALYGGDASCVGVDQYSRLDSVVAWIESYTGVTDAGSPYCGTVDALGMCSGQRAIYCADGTLTSQACGGDEACGWDDAIGGFRCQAGDDPCAGYDRRGSCAGQIATWCDNGVLRERDCRACNERCYFAGSPDGAYCVADSCAGLDFLGQCSGDVAEWCQDGRPQSVDCAATGQRCDYVDDNVGYYCI